MSTNDLFAYRRIYGKFNYAVTCENKTWVVQVWYGEKYVQQIACKGRKQAEKIAMAWSDDQLLYVVVDEVETVSIVSQSSRYVRQQLAKIGKVDYWQEFFKTVMSCGREVVI